MKIINKYSHALMILIPNQKEIFFLVKKNLTQKSFILVYVYYMGSQIALNFWVVVVRSVSSKNDSHADENQMLT